MHTPVTVSAKLIPVPDSDLFMGVLFQTELNFPNLSIVWAEIHYVHPDKFSINSATNACSEKLSSRN